MRLLASGPGWRVEDVTCSAGPQDRPFEEQHDLVCVAAVTRGTFQYRTPNGRATLVPGALMLGNPGACFECGHEHGVGDRCLSFHFDPEFFEEIVASVPGTRRRGKRRRSNPRRAPVSQFQLWRAALIGPMPHYRRGHLRIDARLSASPLTSSREITFNARAQYRQSDHRFHRDHCTDRSRA